MKNENINYDEYKKYLEETELYLCNISMWEIFYFYYIDKYLSFIFEQIKRTKNKIIFVINDHYFFNKMIINMVEKYESNSILINFNFDLYYDTYTFEMIKNYKKNHVLKKIKIDKYLNENYKFIFIKVDNYNIDKIIEKYYKLIKVDYAEINFINYKDTDYDKINCINFEDISKNIVENIKQKNNNFIKKLVKATNNNYFDDSKYRNEVLNNLNYVEKNKFSYIFNLANLININQEYFIKIHKERKDYLNKYFKEFKINLSWDEFKKINLYARDYFRYLSTEQIEWFLFNVNRCIKKLNNLSTNDKKYILAPGDSVSKIVLYIQKLNLCPNCEFILFPLSSAGNKNKNTIKYIESFIPNDFSNLIIMDYIISGSTLKVLLEALESKLNKYSTEKNKLTFNKIKYDIEIILSTNYFNKNSELKLNDKLEINDELEKKNELNNYDNQMNFSNDDKELIEYIQNKKQYTSSYIIDPIVKYDTMDGYNPISIDSFSRCVPSNKKHIKVKKEEYNKIKYECDIIQYILIVNGVNKQHFRMFFKLYYYFFAG